jgi:hypothetical protein
MDDPFLRIVRGAPTPEELAAIVGVLLPRLRAVPPAAERPESRWRASGLPPARRPGPGAWKASALPR